MPTTTRDTLYKLIDQIIKAAEGLSKYQAVPQTNLERTDDFVQFRYASKKQSFTLIFASDTSDVIQIQAGNTETLTLRACKNKLALIKESLEANYGHRRRQEQRNETVPKPDPDTHIQLCKQIVQLAQRIHDICRTSHTPRDWTVNIELDIDIMATNSKKMTISYPVHHQYLTLLLWPYVPTVKCIVYEHGKESRLDNSQQIFECLTRWAEWLGVYPIHYRHYPQQDLERFLRMQTFEQIKNMCTRLHQKCPAHAKCVHIPAGAQGHKFEFAYDAQSEHEPTIRISYNSEFTNQPSAVSQGELPGNLKILVNDQQETLPQVHRQLLKLSAKYFLLNGQVPNEPTPSPVIEETKAVQESEPLTTSPETTRQIVALCRQLSDDHPHDVQLVRTNTPGPTYRIQNEHGVVCIHCNEATHKCSLSVGHGLPAISTPGAILQYLSDTQNRLQKKYEATKHLALEELKDFCRDFCELKSCGFPEIHQWINPDSTPEHLCCHYPSGNTLELKVHADGTIRLTHTILDASSDRTTSSTDNAVAALTALKVRYQKILEVLREVYFSKYHLGTDWAHFEKQKHVLFELWSELFTQPHQPGQVRTGEINLDFRTAWSFSDPEFGTFENLPNPLGLPVLRVTEMSYDGSISSLYPQTSEIEKRLRHLHTALAKRQNPTPKAQTVEPLQEVPGSIFELLDLPERWNPEKWYEEYKQICGNIDRLFEKHSDQLGFIVQGEKAQAYNCRMIWLLDGTCLEYGIQDSHDIFLTCRTPNGLYNNWMGPNATQELRKICHRLTAMVAFGTLSEIKQPKVDWETWIHLSQQERSSYIRSIMFLIKQLFPDQKNAVATFYYGTVLCRYAYTDHEVVLALHPESGDGCVYRLKDGVLLSGQRELPNIRAQLLTLAGEQQ